MPVTPPIPQKTPLGVDAQRKRTADLGQRHRTILFLVDGKRTLSEVIGLAIQAGAAAHHFEDLVRLGYIEVPQPEPPSRPMPLDEVDAIAESLEIDVPAAAPPAEPLVLGEEAVVSRFGGLGPTPEPELPPVSASMPLAPTLPPPPPAPRVVATPVSPPAPQRPAAARAAVAPAVPASPPVLPVPPVVAAKPKVAAPPQPARAPAARPAAPPPPTPQPRPAKVRAPTIISSHGLAPVDKPTVATTRTLRVIPPASHEDDEMLDEVRACLLETVRLDGAAFGKRMAARVRQAAESSDFIGLVWELERETSHSRRSREGLWNLQRARELLGLGNTLVAEDSKPNWPDSE